MLHPTPQHVFAAYKDTLTTGVPSHIDTTDENADWLRENHLKLLRRPHSFTKEGGLWVFAVGRIKVGKPPSELRQSLEALAPGAACEVSAPLPQVRSTIGNINRASGVTYKARQLASGKVHVTRAGLDGGFGEPGDQPTEQSKYGLEAMQVGETRTMPAGTLIDQVRSVAQYQRRRWARTYTVRRTPEGITVTRNS